jgi:hypothetical protein
MYVTEPAKTPEVIDFAEVIGSLKNVNYNICPKWVDAHGMPCVFVIFNSPADREEYRAAFYGKWVRLSDRTARLNYVMDWLDKNGYGLELTTSTAWL